MVLKRHLKATLALDLFIFPYSPQYFSFYSLKTHTHTHTQNQRGRCAVDVIGIGVYIDLMSSR